MVVETLRRFIKNFKSFFYMGKKIKPIESEMQSLKERGTKVTYFSSGKSLEFSTPFEEECEAIHRVIKGYLQDLERELPVAIEGDQESREIFLDILESQEREVKSQIRWLREVLAHIKADIEVTNLNHHAQFFLGLESGNREIDGAKEKFELIQHYLEGLDKKLIKMSDCFKKVRSELSL